MLYFRNSARSSTFTDATGICIPVVGVALRRRPTLRSGSPNAPSMSRGIDAAFVSFAVMDGRCWQSGSARPATCMRSGEEYYDFFRHDDSPWFPLQGSAISMVSVELSFLNRRALINTDGILNRWAVLTFSLTPGNKFPETQLRPHGAVSIGAGLDSMIRIRESPWCGVRRM